MYPLIATISCPPESSILAESAEILHTADPMEVSILKVQSMPSTNQEKGVACTTSGQQEQLHLSEKEQAQKCI